MKEYGFFLGNHRPIGIASPKVVFTVVSGGTRFRLVKLLPKADTFNLSDYVNEIGSEIACWREGQGERTNRKLIVHRDNTHLHTAVSEQRV
jgi:hypothetical protein